MGAVPYADAGSPYRRGSAILLRCGFALFALALLWALVPPVPAVSSEKGFKQYVDPAKRFAIDYPAAMKVAAVRLDEVKIFHPEASLRINVFIDQRPGKAAADAGSLLAAFKKNLKDEMKAASVIEEGKLPGLEGSQGYVICSFKDGRGITMVQLVQYYVAAEKLLQLIISDRPEGFRNLGEVIRKIHRSLKILSPSLK